MAPPLNPDPATAERLLREEQERGDYQLGASPLQLLMEWIERLMNALFRGRGTSTWQETALVAALVAIGLVVLFLLVRRFWPDRRVTESGVEDYAAETRRRAEDHRREARAAAAEGRIDQAVLETVRALIAGSAERGLIELRDGMTIGEVTERLSGVFPAEQELHFAADRFILARYATHRPIDPDTAAPVSAPDGAMAADPHGVPGTENLCTGEDLRRLIVLEQRLQTAAPELEAV